LALAEAAPYGSTVSTGSTAELLEPPRGKVRERAKKVRVARPATRALPHRLGRCTLFDHIGRGGMADIYLARAEAGLGASRLVVVKEVLPNLADSPRFAELLASEARLAAQLHHANIVQVEDLGRDEGVLYIAMEYVEGLDLREILRRCAAHGVALPIDFSLLVVGGILRALDYAHRFRIDGAASPIIHRDVSPSNVLVSFEGEVKLCDFGIARALDAATGTGQHGIEGKAGYMSPEQARGDDLDPRADVFAAGIILWELLAGRRLYKANAPTSLLAQACAAQIPDLPTRELAHEAKLYAIVARALAADRAERYASSAEMLRDLEGYAMQARLMASPLRLGTWMAQHFGSDVIAERRGRERALRAIERGPVVELRPIVAEPKTPLGTADIHASAPVALQPTSPSEASIATTKAPRPRRVWLVAMAVAVVLVIAFVSSR
jgi:serine/threonine-protein kinase